MIIIVIITTIITRSWIWLNMNANKNMNITVMTLLFVPAAPGIIQREHTRLTDKTQKSATQPTQTHADAVRTTRLHLLRTRPSLRYIRGSIVSGTLSRCFLTFSLSLESNSTVTTGHLTSLPCSWVSSVISVSEVVRSSSFITFQYAWLSWTRNGRASKKMYLLSFSRLFFLVCVYHF